MKKDLLVKMLFLVLIGQVSLAQNVGINATGTAPRNCAMLDVVSSNTGLLIPNLALTATNAYAPATGTAVDGLMIYNTATAGAGSTAVYPGYYYWDNTNLKWIAVTGKGGKDWALLGNAGISTPASPATYNTSTIGATENFLGTTDANDIAFGTNNIERMRIKQTTGYVGMGVAAPAAKLHVSRGDIGVGRIDGGDDTPYARFGLSNGWEQYLANNAFYNAGTSQWNYVNTGGYGGMATMMYQISGVLSFYSANNGVNPIAWSQRMTILNNGNIGMSASAPAVTLAVNGNGTNVYATDIWAENNIHVQGNEALTQGGSRGRLRVGSAWGYNGLYTDGSSTGAANDLVLGASSGLVRIGCNGCGQNFKVSGLESSGNRMVMANSNGQLYLGTGTQGYGGNVQSVNGTTDVTINTATWTDMPQMTITFTPVHSTVYVSFSASGDVAASSMMGVLFRVQNNGTTVYGSNTITEDYDNAVGFQSGWGTSFMVPVAVTAGVATTIKVQWARTGIWNGTVRNSPATSPDWSNRVLFIND